MKHYWKRSDAFKKPRRPSINYTARIAEIRAKEEAECVQRMTKEHLMIQKNYELLNSPLRPKSALDKDLTQSNLSRSDKERTAGPALIPVDISKRPSTRQSHESAPNDFDPANLDKTPVILPLHLDPIARAEIERKARIAEEAAESEEAQLAAAALAAEIENELTAANKAITARNSEKDHPLKDEVSAEKASESHGESEDEGPEISSDSNTTSVPAGTQGIRKRRRKAFMRQSQDSEDDSGGDDGKSSSTEAANTIEEPSEVVDEEKSVKPMLKVYRRSRPSLAGIRQMVKPTDAASAFCASVDMFHRSPRSRRHEWDTSLPLPPDSEHAVAVV